MLDLLLYTLALLAAAVLAVLALPIAIRLEVARCTPPAAPELGGTAGVALGLIGIAARGRGNSWQVRLRLVGLTLPRPSFCLGPHEGQGAETAAAVAAEARVEPEQAETEAAAPAATTGAPGPAAPAAEADAQAAPPAARAGPPEAPSEVAGAKAGAASLAARLRRGLDLVDLAGPPAVGLARSLPRVLRLRRGRVSGRFGFADPAQTGQVMGVLEGLGARAWQRLQVRLVPDWVDPRVRVRGDVLLHLHLGLLLCYVVRCAAKVGWRWLASRMAAFSWLPGAAR